MLDPFDFEDLRPYTDQEVPAVIERLLQEPMLYEVMEWVYPGLDQADIQEMFEDVHTVDDFQQNISGPVFKVVTQMTTSGLSFTNMDVLDYGTPYLFLSNHRDIILDSALLNVSLMEKGHQTTQIAIGNNLLRNPLIYDLVRINKNFIVHRDINPREMLAYSQRLSNYIRRTLLEDKTSIWIAHKEGRSKDGDDRTATGLLKMLGMSGEEGLVDSLGGLNIVPMVVSYEFDPCDILKTNELLNVKLNGAHEKMPGEDFKSMMLGVTGHKGGVNIAVGTPINDRVAAWAGDGPRNEQLRNLTAAIDREMHLHYKLWPSNYVAYDLLHGTREYRGMYTSVQKITFRNYLRQRMLKLMIARKKLGHERAGFQKQVREILLQMYANPVINYRESISVSEVASEVK